MQDFNEVLATVFVRQKKLIAQFDSCRRKLRLLVEVAKLLISSEQIWYQTSQAGIPEITELMH